MNIDQRASRYERDIVSLTKRLVGIPTVNPPGSNYMRMVSVLERECRKIGLKTRRYKVPNSEFLDTAVNPTYPRICLIAEWETGATKWLHINAHYDVVPATSFWKTDPFKPVVKKQRLYGRGSADMKSDIAATLYAIRIIRELGIVPRVNIQLSFVPDEETGGRLGFRYMVRRRLVKADYIIGEGHHGNSISIGNKGLLWLKVVVIGKSSHAAYAYKGVNAFEYAAELAMELKKLKEKVVRRRSRLAFSDSRQRHPTLVLGGLLTGGNKTNTVPDKVTFSIDRRVLPDEDFDRAKVEILAVIRTFRKKNRSIRVRVTGGGADKPVLVDGHSRFIRLFAQCVRTVSKKKPKLRVLSGGTDLRFMLYSGIPGVGYSPDGENMHADNEYVKIPSIVKTTRVLCHLLAQIRSF